MWDERVNTAIDEVARQMTEGSPAGSADFRRRVLAGVESGDAPRAAWRAAFVLSPLAVAAAIVTAMFVARGFQPRDRVPALRQAQGTPSSPRGERTAPQETPTVAQSLAPDTTNRGVTNSAALQNQTVRRPGPFGPGIAGGSDEPALRVDALDVAPLTVDALTPDPIQIERLDTISPINVAPLDITDVQRRYE